MPNTTSLNSKSILNNISFKVQSSTVNFEKIEGNLRGTYPQEVILDDSRLPFKIGLTSDGALKIEKLKDENYSYTIEMNYRYNEATLGVFKITVNGKTIVTKGEVNIKLSNPVVGSFYSSLGRLRIHSNSSVSTSPLMEYLNKSDEAITSEIKNSQYKLGKISGKYIPVVPDNFGGNRLEVIFNNGLGEVSQIVELKIDQNGNFNGTLEIFNYDNNGVTTGIRYQNPTKSKYGTDIYLDRWDLEAKNVTLQMKHPLMENKFNITIPEFNGEAYYNKNISQISPTEVDYSIKTLRGNFVRDHSGNIELKFNIGTKDYDLRILEKDNGNINFLFQKKFGHPRIACVTMVPCCCC